MTADFYWGVLCGAGAVLTITFLFVIIGVLWLERDNRRCDPIGPRGKERLP